mgnify:FL=1
MENLFSESRQKFDNFFSETYGTLYVQNRKIFDMYFSALEDYFRYGHVDVAQVTQEFFQTIFQKMFMAMNPQYEYSEQYQRCIKAQMESVKPFGEVPEKLASSLKRSLVATRILHKSVQSAFEIVNQMSMVRIKQKLAYLLATVGKICYFWDMKKNLPQVGFEPGTSRLLHTRVADR